MTKTAYPFDAGAGANTMEDQWRKMARLWCPTGVIDGDLNGLVPFGDSTGMQIKVMSGRAWVQGHFFESDAQETIAIGASHATLARYDRLVLRVDFTANTIDFAILAGTAAASPVPVLPTQSTAMWEIALATIYVGAAASTITAVWVNDERPLIYPAQTSRPVPFSENLLVNGGFEVWQRGTGPFTANGTMGPDRWMLTVPALSTMSVSQTTGGVPTGTKTMCGITTTRSSGTGQCTLSQKIENYIDLSGRVITFSVRVHTPTANAVRVHINNSYQAVSSKAHSGSGTWETLSVTLALPSQASMTSLHCHILIDNPATVYVDSATLCLGGIPGVYVPVPLADDVARCKRYYEALGYYYQFSGYAGVAGNIAFQVPYVTKGGTPTVTKVGTWSVANCGQPVVSLATPTHCLAQINASGVGHAASSTQAGTDAITVEWNP